MFGKTITKITKFVLLFAALSPAIVVFGSAAYAGQTQSPTPEAVKGPSGLPLPRFVSLKADRVNVRKGPSKEHGVNWIYRRLGLPVEIIQEFEHWRQIRDSEGSEGWVFYRLLSERRTVLIAPWSANDENNTSKNPIPILSEPSASSKTVVQVEAGVLANILICDGNWCQISLDKFRGWIEQEKLWGVYRGETLN